jgi:hypothetical protein
MKKLVCFSFLICLLGCGVINDLMLAQRRNNKLELMQHDLTVISSISAIVDTTFAGRHFGQVFFGSFDSSQRKLIAFLAQTDARGTNIGYVYGVNQNSLWHIYVVSATLIGHKIDSDGAAKFDHYKTTLIEQGFFEENSDALSQQFWIGKQFPNVDY